MPLQRQRQLQLHHPRRVARCPAGCYHRPLRTCQLAAFLRNATASGAAGRSHRGRGAGGILGLVGKGPCRCRTVRGPSCNRLDKGPCYNRLDRGPCCCLWGRLALGSGLLAPLLTTGKVQGTYWQQAGRAAGLVVGLGRHLCGATAVRFPSPLNSSGGRCFRAAPLTAVEVEVLGPAGHCTTTVGLRGSDRGPRMPLADYPPPQLAAARCCSRQVYCSSRPPRFHCTVSSSSSSRGAAGLSLTATAFRWVTQRGCSRSSSSSKHSPLPGADNLHNSCYHRSLSSSTTTSCCSSHPHCTRGCPSRTAAGPSSCRPHIPAAEVLAAWTTEAGAVAC